MEKIQIGPNAPIQPQHEILPPHFYNLLQRQLVLHWYRRKTGNVAATEDDVGMEAINWVMDGYGAAYERVYKAKEARQELRGDDMENLSILSQWLVDLDNDIEKQRRGAA